MDALRNAGIPVGHQGDVTVTTEIGFRELKRVPLELSSSPVTC